VGLLILDQKLSLGKITRIQGKALKRLRERAGRVGEILTLRDKEGRDFRARIVALTPQCVEAFVFESFRTPVEPFLEIDLLQALPKKERFEWIIQKATELGVYSIVPFESDRSMTLEERDALQKKSHRWQTIATKAAQQCRRARIPLVHPVTSFSNALELGQKSDLTLLLWEKEPTQGIKQVLKDVKCRVRKLTFAVGPEGGFTLGELETARQNGFQSVSLGERILRTETAAITALAILQYELGDLGGGAGNGKRVGAKD
jgi:16S rRNA (uracil1498-N3)-methyltransferase